jgi:hypothetical protein
MGTRSACGRALQGRYLAAVWGMIRKSGCWFSEKIMLKSNNQSGMTIRTKVITLKEQSVHNLIMLSANVHHDRR